MGKEILTGITAYISTSLDYLIILMVIFGTVKKNNRMMVYFGDLLGTAILVGTSLIIAFVLKAVPAEWLMGLLGLIPVYMGVKLFSWGEDDDDDEITSRMAKPTSIVWNVAIITIATCGADNIGIYVPLFTQSSVSALITILVTFFFMLTLFCWIGYNLVRLPVIANVLEKWGRYITAVVYVLLGLFILMEAGTFSHLFGML